ncbi:leucine--tRNA ligase [Cytobacillus praedii]|uniref:leucine--tRNA ligase n=1 Tax=Cytobacillus praedii TaxID=1742358 RepID=UPI002E1E88FE|nr:leucine--tRNA ligase [Cytobacillus praedii]MED3575520.1 leucine--tRNA ligase [Cytobacillus praedii]
MLEYNFNNIEEKWQKHWDSVEAFKTKDEKTKKKYYVLEQFPYPSGDGLHMGHVRVYTIGDVLARYKKIQGYNVLHPMGADAFGLPAENAAIQRKINPADWTTSNMKKIVQEQKSLGISYDWERYLSTCLPDYYKHTQFLFLKMFEKQLAYRKEGLVNWCEKCTTVLANEQVEDGKCWRCSSNIIKKDLNQWYIKITEYQDRLIDDLDELKEWPSTVKTMQKNWIGRVSGWEVPLKVKGKSESISVFVEKCRSFVNLSYIEISPNHEIIEQLIHSSDMKINNFINKEKNKVKEYKNKFFEGYFTGSVCIHPITQQEIPIYVTNSFEQEDKNSTLIGKNIEIIATQSNIEINESKERINKILFDDVNAVVTDEEYDLKIENYLVNKAIGQFKTTFKLRDWLISRQRYWGCPIPIIYCDSCGTVPVPADQLPVILPEDVTFSGNDNPMKTSSEFVNCDCPTCGGSARRETDTMDTFIDSSWYYLRYVDAHNKEKPFESGIVNEWLSVDEYVGGIEHAVLHLLYSRFITKFLYDIGYVNFKEPFKKLVTQGMVLKDGIKMSKSKGNVVSPTEIIDKYGADTLRLFILFAAPVHRDLEWSESGVEGCYRFLKKLWNYVHVLETAETQDIAKDKKIKELIKLRGKTVKKVTMNLEEGNSLNTAISSLMHLLNFIYALEKEYVKSNEVKDTIREVLIMLAPFTPHICEELWQRLNHTVESVHSQKWPKYNEEMLKDEKTEIVVQINGKLREKIEVETDLDEIDLKEKVFQLEKVKSYLNNKIPSKTIVIPNKLINIVIKG